MMKKNFKKYLSYVLGIVLAMGLGLSYAYAVGANDSNAFVTTTEWQAKVAQLESSLDNVNKTIGDTNMDFVVNGPRLQTNMVDGAQSCVSLTNADGGYLYPYRSHETTVTATNNVYDYYCDYFLPDLWNGRQNISKVYWATSDTSSTTQNLKYRYALATTTPGWYIVVSVFGGSSWFWHYVKVGKYPIESSVTAKTFEVKFNKNEWGWPVYSRGTTISALGRTTTAVFMGNVGMGNEYISYNTAGGLDGFSSNNGAITRTIEGDVITQKFEFIGAYYAMRSTGQAQAYFPFYPLNMTNRKFGNYADRVLVSPTATGEVAKVYSLVKGCYCLKSYVNGEIPILNE